MAIYKRGRGFELGKTENKSSKWPERDSNPGPPDCEPLDHADSLFTEVALESGSLLSNCTMGQFLRGDFFFYWLSRGWGETVSKFGQNISIVRFVTTL